MLTTTITQSLSSIRTRTPFMFLVRCRHKLKGSQKAPPKVSTDVVTYLETLPHYDEIKESIPRALLRKYKTPEHMYFIHKTKAKEIAAILKSHLDKTSPVVEVNPGFGYLSEELLNCGVQHLYMYEYSPTYSHFIKELQGRYPNRITYKTADFFGMWKLAFQDKMDSGNRIKDLLGDLATEDHDRIVKVVGAMPGLSFVKHLMTTIIFHNTHNQIGRPDLFITMSGQHYDTLTDTKVQDTRSSLLPALFQLLFDYKVITKIPRVYYLPWIQSTETKKSSVMEDYCLYLVNITQKEKMPCSSEHLPLLRHFLRPRMISRSTRVIPMLEQWIPGCGVWLITGQDPPDTNRALAPGPEDATLPHINIFTEFGDLTLNQKLTVFKKFISWPEFEQCPFRVSMENNLPRFITALEKDDKDNIGIHLDDEDDSSDVEH